MSTEQNRIKVILGAIEASGLKNHIKNYTPIVGIEELDDCAVIPMNNLHDMVLGSDFVRGEGFYLFKENRLNYKDIGRYLAGANLSDIAAMGATPIGLLTVVRYKKEMKDSEFKGIFSGIIEVCKENSTLILGGDTGGYEEGVLSASAIGFVRKNKALLRKNAESNDLIYLTGDVGMAGAALAYFTRGVKRGIKLNTSEEKLLLKSWKKVTPAISAGKLLSELNLSKCAIDTSDGLKASIEQLSNASKKNMEINSEKIPIHPLVKKVANLFGIPHIAFASSDSVDFRLCFTSPRKSRSRLLKVFNENDLPLYEIGRVGNESKKPQTLLRISKNEVAPFPGVAWDQSEKNTIDRLLDLRTK